MCYNVQYISITLSTTEICCLKFPIGDCGEDNNRNLSFVEYSIRYITGVVTCILGALNINKSQLSIVLPFNRHLKFCHLASVDIHIYMITSFCLTIIGA